MKKYLIGGIAGLLVALSAAPLAAQDAPAAEVKAAATATAEPKSVDQTYYAMFEQLYGSVDQNLLVENTVAATIAVMKQNAPQVALLSRKVPDLDRRLAEVIRPLMKQHQANLLPAQREATAQLIASHMSPAEAKQVMAFYASPLGRKAITAASGGMDNKATIANAAKTGEISASDINRDMHSAGMATQRALAGKMSVVEQRQLIAFMRTSAYIKLLLVSRDLPAMRARLENTPMDPELEAKAQADIAEVLLDAREAAEKKPK